MHLTDQATYSPGRCAISGETSGPFVDTGMVLRGVDGHVYLSVKALVHNVAPIVGLSPNEDVESLRAECDALVAEVEELRAFKADTEKLFERIAKVVEAVADVPDEKPTPVKRGPGRPKKNA